MKRPLGVTLTACVLLLGAALLLLAEVLLVFSAASSGPKIGIRFLGIAVLSVPLVGLLVWFLLTGVGLFRLRPSAKTSMQVLAILLVLGSLAEFAGAVLISTIATQHAEASTPGYQLGYLVGALLPGVAGLALAIWWLIYFNLQAVSAAFQQAWLQQPPAYAYPAQPYAPVMPSSQPPFAPYPVRKPGRFDRVPGSIQLTAAFLALGALCALIAAVTPFPAFVLGMLVGGATGHFFWALFAVTAGLCAWGLVQLRGWSLPLAYLFCVFGCVNVFVSLTPPALRNLDRYAQSIFGMFHIPGQPEFRIHYTLGMMLPSAVLGLVMYVAAAYFLHKHRALFTSPSQPLGITTQ